MIKLFIEFVRVLSFEGYLCKSLKMLGSQQSQILLRQERRPVKFCLEATLADPGL